MSANLDLVRSIYADWERGNWSRADWADPEIEYVATGGVEPGNWRGLAEVAVRWRSHLAAWEDYRMVADEYRQLDAERVLVLQRVSGKGKRSGIELGQAWSKHACLFDLQDGKVIRMVFYYDRDRALADLGLERSAVAEESTMPDPLELGQRLNYALNARDIDAAISLFAPDAVFDGPETFGVFEGRGAIRGLFEEWLGAYDEFEWEVEERRDLGSGVVLSVGRQRGRPRGSTGWVQIRGATVVTWVDGLIERSTNYLNVDQARAAAERLAEERG